MTQASSPIIIVLSYKDTNRRSEIPHHPFADVTPRTCQLTGQARINNRLTQRKQISRCSGVYQVKSFTWTFWKQATQSRSSKSPPSSTVLISSHSSSPERFQHHHRTRKSWLHFASLQEEVVAFIKRIEAIVFLTSTFWSFVDLNWRKIRSF